MDSLQSRLGYVPSFDGIRAFAVLMVMFVHAHFQLGENGQIGVSVFFTLSGFLITTLLIEDFQSGNYSLKGFYLRRAMRLFPSLYTMLFIVLLYTIFFTKGTDKILLIKEIIPASLYFYNISWFWGLGTGSILLGHTWSLAIEEQFYLIFPWILLLFFKKNGIKRFKFFLIIFISISLLYKLLNFYPTIIDSLIQESIFIGCIGALLWKEKILIPISEFITLLSFLFILIVGIFPIKLPFNFFNITSIITLVLIFGLLINKNKPTSKFLSNSFIVLVGKISYSLYLWHLPIFRWFAMYSKLPPSISFILKFVVTFMVAYLSWILIEKRAIKYGRDLSARLNQKTRKI